MASKEDPASASDEVAETIDAKDIELKAANTQKESATAIQTPQASAAPSLQGLKFWAVTLGVCLGALMMSLDISIISTVRLSSDAAQ